MQFCVVCSVIVLLWGIPFPVVLLQLQQLLFYRESRSVQGVSVVLFLDFFVGNFTPTLLLSVFHPVKKPNRRVYVWW